ncbi:MAG: hypothetical protein H7A36_05935 [Chlamydiales bacterium]|nr:hypothetical protein [Chlamydiales bacterium]
MAFGICCQMVCKEVCGQCPPQVQSGTTAVLGITFLVCAILVATGVMMKGHAAADIKQATIIFAVIGSVFTVAGSAWFVFSCKKEC